MYLYIYVHVAGTSENNTGGGHFLWRENYEKSIISYSEHQTVTRL